MMMADQDVVRRPPRCSTPELNDYVAAYCFGDASEDERRLFEAHLLDCDFCWEEVRRFSAAVETLRSGKDLIRSVSPADVSALIGPSAKLQWPFAGHTIHVLVASALYALLYVVGLLSEVAYAFDRLGGAALRIAPLVFLWILATSVLALWGCWKCLVQRRVAGLAVSIGAFASAALLLYGALCFFLPASPITQASFQTYTAQAAYMKGIRYALPLAAVFCLVPFHFVVAMQRELKDDHHRLGLALLTGESWAVAPPSAFFIRVRSLWVTLLVLLLISIPMSSHLFDHLTAGPYMNLFTHLMQLRWILYFGFALECLAWYSRALNEIKRECLLVEGAPR